MKTAAPQRHAPIVFLTALILSLMPLASRAQETPADPAAPAAETTSQKPGVKKTTTPKAKKTRLRPPAPADSEPEILPEPTPPPPPVVEEVRTPNLPADACADGHLVDDGIVDKGFSFVDTAKWGMYVQEIQSQDFPSRHLNEVCVCWFQKPGGSDADFEVVFFTAEGARPSMEPYATVKGKAKALGEGKRDAKWHTVDVAGVSLPEGTSYFGVRWKPKKERRLYVCSDQSVDTVRQKGLFGEDRSRGWIDMETTADPIFIPHRALMLRPVSHPEGWQPPPAKAEPAASATPQVETGS